MKSETISQLIAELETKRRNARRFPKQMAIHQKILALKAELAALTK